MKKPVVALTVLAAASLIVDAQIPQTFKNLQVLPKDIARGELVGTMRGIAGGLGVRCAHCHVGPDNLEGMDFASDDKPTKRAARVMIQMVRTMNADYVSKIPEHEGGRMPVTCQTCHRTAQRPPRPIEETLYETAAAKGVPAAVQQFREMREQFSGSGLYDFRERTLNALGTRMLDNKRPDDAVAVFQANLEFFPRSVNAMLTIGRIATQRGDKAMAETYLRKVLEVDPKNEFAQKALESLKQKQ